MARVTRTIKARKVSEVAKWIAERRLWFGSKQRKIKLYEWQEDFLDAITDDISTAGLSVARGNGKTTLLAALALYYLHAARLHHQQIVVVASSMEQGRILFDAAMEMMTTEERMELQISNTIQNSSMINPITGMKLKVVASDPKRAHGLRNVVVAILDEPAQWPANQRDAMYAAIKTSLGKVPNSKLIAIGTQSKDSTHWFQRGLAKEFEVRRTYAPQKDKNGEIPDSYALTRKAVLEANPSCKRGGMPDLLKQVMREMAEAKESEFAIPQFKALRLNLGVSEIHEEFLVSPSAWFDLAEETPEMEMNSGRLSCVWGIDLGGTKAMSAVACYAYRKDYLDAVAQFPGKPDLEERGRLDGVEGRYLRMWRQGDLTLAIDSLVPDYEKLLNSALARWGQPKAIVCDTYHETELLQALADSKVQPVPVEVRKGGYDDGGHDIEEFRRAVLEKELRVYNSLLMLSAVSEARVQLSSEGKEKLARGSASGKRLRGRDDAAAAMVIAVALGRRMKKAEAGKDETQYAVV